MGAAHALSRLARVVVTALATAACGPRVLPPLGEVVVVVDTDLPVPRVASVLRVDTYEVDGAWIESREIALRDPRDWPASFSIQAADDTRDRAVVVRVRVHGGRTRDATGPARLVVGGADVTPPSEPEPLLAVDRLSLVVLRPGERARLQITARASCAGVPARLEPGAYASCLEGEGTLEPVAASSLEPELSLPTASSAGSAARTPCASPGPSERPCVEGGAFLLGSEDLQIVPDPALPPAPQRLARVSTFTIDRDEITVARFRGAVARGFVPPDLPGVTEGELGTTAKTTCAYSATPRGREAYAMTCVTWSTARAYCQRAGGDLPTEAQWEYAATSAGRAGTTTFPWGDDAPDCARAIYGRLALAGLLGSCEAAAGSGPRAAANGDGTPLAPGDLAAVGVRGLGGGVAEWMRDAPRGYESAGWREVDPVSLDPRATAHVVRGGAWASTAINVRSAARTAASKAASFIGFRCVYAP